MSRVKEITEQEQLNHFLELHSLEPVFGAELLPHLALYEFGEGERICVQGEVSHHLYVLVHGRIKVYTTSAEGRTMVLLSFKQPLEVIGDIEYLQTIELLNTVEAVTPVIMIGVRYEALDRYGRGHLPLVQFLLQILSAKFLGKSKALGLNLMHPVDVRLASYLLSVCPEGSDQQFVRTDTLADAASLIGTSYRHLNRVLQQFSAAGLIQRDKGRIIIKDREGLRRMGLANIYE